MNLPARSCLLLVAGLTAAGCTVRYVRPRPYQDPSAQGGGPPPQGGQGGPVQTPQPAPTPGLQATGTFLGAPVSLQCATFSPSNTAKDAAYYTNQPGLVYLACHDEASGVALAVTVLKLGAFTLTPGPDPMATGGRIELRHGDETLATDAAGVEGKISLRTWDTSRRRLVGTFSLSWDKDSSGSKGSISGQFDVAGIHAAQ